MLVGDLADELLREVLDRDDAGQAAILVDDARELVTIRRQLPQHVWQRHHRGDDRDAARNGGDRHLVGLPGGEHVLQVDDADDVTGAVEDGVSAVARGHALADPPEQVCLTDDVDSRPRDHRVLGVLGREVEDPVEQDRQVVRQLAALA